LDKIIYGNPNRKEVFIRDGERFDKNIKRERPVQIYEFEDELVDGKYTEYYDDGETLKVEAHYDDGRLCDYFKKYKHGKIKIDLSVEEIEEDWNKKELFELKSYAFYQYSQRNDTNEYSSKTEIGGFPTLFKKLCDMVLPNDVTKIEKQLFFEYVRAGKGVWEWEWKRRRNGDYYKIVEIQNPMNFSLGNTNIDNSKTFAKIVHRKTRDD